MDDWFDVIRSGGALSPEAARALGEDGFVVLPGAVSVGGTERVAAAYDVAVASASAADVKVGRTTTRVDDFVSRGAEFEGLYVFPPLLEACARVIGRAFKLSALHARTLRPGAAAQDLHVDVPRDSDAWPLVGFILMIDAFRTDNGATRFVPGSHRWSADEDAATRLAAAEPVSACGPAGSLLVFDGSTWHGHSANGSREPRRSVQGAFIPRDAHAAVDWRTRLRPETLDRLDPLARYVLALS